MDVLKRILGKRVFEKGASPAFCGETLGEILDVFIGRFFTAGAGAWGKRPGRLGRHMVIPAAPRARRISARPVMVSQIGGAPFRLQSGRTLLEMLSVLAIMAY